VVERLLLLATGDAITVETVESALPRTSAATDSTVTAGPLADRVQNFEREAILAELKQQNYHITNTARALGLERSHLYKKAEQLGIDIQKTRRGEDATGSNA
jgi:two-component system, NtrC family, nitrogen regulation response regulator NtrX